MPPTGTFQPNGDVPREFQQSMMEMSDDSITSIDPAQQHGQHDWSSSGQMIQNTATVDMPGQSRNVSNGIYATSSQENGRLIHN